MKIDYYGSLAGLKESKKNMIERGKDIMGLSSSDIINILGEALNSGYMTEIHFKMIISAFSEL